MNQPPPSKPRHRNSSSKDSEVIKGLVDDNKATNEKLDKLLDTVKQLTESAPGN